jgi:hypothetical protein
VRMVILRLGSKLPVRASLERLMRLFDVEAVKYRVENDSLHTTKIPFAIFTLDPRMYSRRNWLGLNPFVFATSMNVDAVACSDESTVLEIVIDRRRSVILYLVAMANVLFVSWQLPSLWGGLTLFVLFGCLFAALFFWFPTSQIKQEILHAIE